MPRTLRKSLPIVNPKLLAQRNEWVLRVAKLIEQIKQWSAKAGWPVELAPEVIDEEPFGQYEAPAARVTLPRGDLPERALLVIPIALRVASDALGRVDLEGYPTLSRVQLLGNKDGGWTIMTDSNVPIRQPWTARTFRQLAEDLVA